MLGPEPFRGLTHSEKVEGAGQVVPVITQSPQGADGLCPKTLTILTDDITEPPFSTYLSPLWGEKWERQKGERNHGLSVQETLHPSYRDGCYVRSN